MKKVTKAAVSAFVKGENFNSANTQVLVWGNEVVLKLHKNVIAMRLINERTFKIRNANWFSNTTKERLNGLPNVTIQQKNFEWFLNSEKWDGKWAEIHF